MDAVFGAIISLYEELHLPGLRHSTRETNTYLLTNYIEPKFPHLPIRGVTPLVVTRWFSELKLAPTTKAAIRSLGPGVATSADTNG